MCLVGRPAFMSPAFAARFATRKWLVSWRVGYHIVGCGRNFVTGIHMACQPRARQLGTVLTKYGTVMRMTALITDDEPITQADAIAQANAQLARGERVPAATLAAFSAKHGL
jgi:hypothetical protein